MEGGGAHYSIIQQFMVWRVPTREIGAVPYQEGLELPPEYITRDSG